MHDLQPNNCLSGLQKLFHYACQREVLIRLCKVFVRFVRFSKDHLRSGPLLQALDEVLSDIVLCRGLQHLGKVVIQHSSMGSVRYWQVCTPQTSGVIELPGLPESGMKYSVGSVTDPITEIVGSEK
jgi:hypothetical protein